MAILCQGIREGTYKMPLERCSQHCNIYGYKCVLYWICLIPGIYALYHLVCVPTLVARAAAALMGLSCRELRRSLCWNFAPAWSRSIIILCINTRMLPASIIVILRMRNYHFANSNLPTGMRQLVTSDSSLCSEVWSWIWSWNPTKIILIMRDVWGFLSEEH